MIVVMTTTQMLFISSRNLPQSSQIGSYIEQKDELPGELDARRANRRSLHYAPPDFL